MAKKKKAPPQPPEEEQSPPEKDGNPLLFLAWLVAGIPVFWFAGYTRMMGSDLWWHLASGRWMLEHRQIVHQDPFSFTVYGQEWVHHEWLCDVLLAVWEQAFGAPSLVFWKWGIIIATHLLMFRVVSLVTKEYPAAFAATVIASWTAAPFLDIRPQLYTFFCFTLLLNLLAGERSRWFIPLLMACWVNLHGGFFLGLMVGAVTLVPEFIWQPENRKKIGILAGASFLGTLLNPRGLETVIFPLRYVFIADSPYLRLQEWLPPLTMTDGHPALASGLNSPLYPWTLGLLAVALVAWFFHPLRREDPARFWGYTAIALLTTLMSLKSRRFIPVFSLGQALVLGPALSLLLIPGLRRWPKAVLPVLTFFFGVYAIAPYHKNVNAFPRLTALDAFPVDLCDFMEINQLEGDFFCLYNYGGYLHLRGQGRWRVFIDGRADTVYPIPLYEEYLKVHQRRPGWREVIENSQANFVIWPHRNPELLKELSQNGWRVIYEDAVAALLARDGHPVVVDKVPQGTPQHAFTLGLLHMEKGNFKESEQLLLQAARAWPTPMILAYLEMSQARQGKSKAAYQTKLFREQLQQKNFITRLVYPPRNR